MLALIHGVKEESFPAARDVCSAGTIPGLWVFCLYFFCLFFHLHQFTKDMGWVKKQKKNGLVYLLSISQKLRSFLSANLDSEKASCPRWSRQLWSEDRSVPSSQRARPEDGLRWTADGSKKPDRCLATFDHQTFNQRSMIMQWSFISSFFLLYPCSIETREVLGNPSPTPERFPETREMSRPWNPRDISRYFLGFANISRVLVEYGHSIIINAILGRRSGNPLMYAKAYWTLYSIPLCWWSHYL